MTTKLASQRQLNVTEVLDLHLLPEEGLRYDQAIDADWLEEQLAEINTEASPAVHPDGDGWAKIDVEPLAPVATRPPIRVHGNVTAAVSTTCVRCLQPIEQKVAASIDLTLFAREHAERDDASKAAGTDDELTRDELDEGIYDENVLDIPELVREALILEIAMHPRCADEAACSDRTDALIKAANREAEEAVDDRWAALKALRDATKNGTGQGNPS